MMSTTIGESVVMPLWLPVRWATIDSSTATDVGSPDYTAVGQPVAC